MNGDDRDEVSENYQEAPFRFTTKDIYYHRNPSLPIFRQGVTHDCASISKIKGTLCSIIFRIVHPYIIIHSLE